MTYTELHHAKGHDRIERPQLRHVAIFDMLSQYVRNLLIFNDRLPLLCAFCKPESHHVAFAPSIPRHIIDSLFFQRASWV